MLQRAILACIICITLVGCKTVDTWQTSERTYRDYVLYRCLETGLDAKSFFSKDMSLIILNEETNNTISEGKIGRYLDSLVKRKVDSIPTTQVGPPDQKAIYLYCIDYYNSKELRNDIKKVMKLKKEYDREIEKEIMDAVSK